MANNISKEPTQNFMEHLKKREGTLNLIYKDTSDLATGGTGHLLTESEKSTYGINESTKYVDYKTKYGMRKVATDEFGGIIGLDKTVTEDWLKADSSKYYEKGKSWAKELGAEDQGMVDALSGVSFQFPAFKEKMPSAWGAIKSGNMEEAINQMKFKSGIPGTAKSDWFAETPDRVEDIASALTTYGASQKKSIDPSGIAFEAMSKIDKPLGI